MQDLCIELVSEHAALDDIVKGLNQSQWQEKTPFCDWTIHDEICHIAAFDSKAKLSATDPDGFQKDMEVMLTGIADIDDFFENAVKDMKKLSPKELMEYWINVRTGMIKAFSKLDPIDKLPWYGLPMNAKSFLIARMMETWAHGQDIADALKIKREPTSRLKHIAHLGVTTFSWSFMNRQLEKPSQKVRIELKGPEEEAWLWNTDQSENTITGTAEDFCLVVAQRRHVDDTELITKGDIARQWMTIAQAFAGPAENGPEAGKFKD